MSADWLRPSFAECADCDGTGAEKPDCYLCKGMRSIKVRRAYAFGWRKGDLRDIEDDGHCECPHCEGHSCGYCEGDGQRPLAEMRQEVARVLHYARRGRNLPPLRVIDHRGNPKWDHDAYLSKAATRACRNAGLISWFCSAFGDELSLTPAGERLFVPALPKDQGR